MDSVIQDDIVERKTKMGYEVTFNTLHKIFIEAAGVDIESYMDFKPARCWHTGLVSPIAILHCYAMALQSKYTSTNNIILEIKKVLEKLSNSNTNNEQEKQKIKKIMDNLNNTDTQNQKILRICDAYTGGHLSHLKGCELDYDLNGNENKLNPVVHINITRDILKIEKELRQHTSIFRVGCYIFPVDEQNILTKTENYISFLNSFGNRKKCRRNEINDPSTPCVGGTLHLGACKKGWETPSHCYGPANTYRMGAKKVFFGRNPSIGRRFNHQLINNIEKYPGLLQQGQINSVSRNAINLLYKLGMVGLFSLDSDPIDRRPSKNIFFY